MAKLGLLTMLAFLGTASLARADGAATSNCDQDPRCYGRELAVALTSQPSTVLLRRVVEFEPGRVRVYSKSREKIQAIVRTWQQRTDWSEITVEGYAGDSVELAQRRADKIRGYLIRYGVPPERIVATGRTGGSTVELSIQLCRGDAHCQRKTTALR
jgi:outer membrane protein OmpA-like peptidoglycan-associated protein